MSKLLYSTIELHTYMLLKPVLPFWNNVDLLQRDTVPETKPYLQKSTHQLTLQQGFSRQAEVHYIRRKDRVNSL